MSYNLKLIESFSPNTFNASLTSEQNPSNILHNTTSELIELSTYQGSKSSSSGARVSDVLNFKAPTNSSTFQDNSFTQVVTNQEIQASNSSVFDYLHTTNHQPNDNSSDPLGTTSLNPIFTNFSVFDASGDNTSNSVFEGGTLRLSYDLGNILSLLDVRLEALKGDRIVSTLGTWNQANLSNELIHLANFADFTGDSYQLRAVARTTDGQEFSSDSQAMNVLSWNRIDGTFKGETIDYTADFGTGAVIIGRGGTDTLNLSGLSPSSITSINGIGLADFNPLSNSTANQAIFKGTAFDHINLADGREIYLQGIERLRFSDSSIFELQVRTNDTFFGSQWNLHISDVGSAWRFTQGASDVLLASLDTGILTASGASGDIVDIAIDRLITDPTDDDNFNNYGHGHCAISIMSSTANNSSGIAGINWNSSVYVNDVYRGVSLQQAIQDTISYARARNQRVVFQGGIQGNWFNSGGTREQLEQLIRDNSDIAIFAIAAGNGGPGGNLSDPDYLTSVSGVAQLETTHDNVISVGALRNTSPTTKIDGLTNASAVNLASYSNRGSNLTLVAATDSPAMDKFGNMRFFGGTSGANPNVAGIASLVWSVNSSLTGGQVRQILIDTAIDLGVDGRDNTFGYGLVNADAAVRRAVALQRNSDVANLYSGRSIFV